MTIWSAEIKEIEVLYTSMKSRFPELEKELKQLIETKDANVVMLYSRRCLEVIVNDLCESELNRPRKTEPLKGIIDKLNKEEKVPAHIITSMHGLNDLSTFGAHPKEFDPQQVRPVLINLTTIIKWYLNFKAKKTRITGKEKTEKYENEKPVEARETIPVVKPKNKSVIIISGILIIGVIVVFVLDVFNIFHKDKFEDIRDPYGRISIAVMPFENLTGDTTLNWFQRGISSLIINGLGNSSELAMRDDHAMYEVMQSMDQVFTAGISPSQAKEVAEKLRAETYISGSYQGAEGTYWVLANLIDTKSGNIIWTNKVEGDLKSSGYLDLANSLCNKIKDYLEIKVLKQEADYDFREAYTESSEAYRYFIEGMNSILTLNYKSAIESFNKALEIDSGFTFAKFFIAWAYISDPQWQWEYVEPWILKAYYDKDKLPFKYQLWLELYYANYISKNLPDIIKYCNLLEESNIQSRLLWFDLGTFYLTLNDSEKAVKAFEKVEQINLERNSSWEYRPFYTSYGEALHKIGKHEKEEEIYELGLKLCPEISGPNDLILRNKAVCALSRGDTTRANEWLQRIKDRINNLGYPEYVKEYYVGYVYEEANMIDKAAEHFRNVYRMAPEDNRIAIYTFGRCLILHDINIEEGMELVDQAIKLLATEDDGKLYFVYLYMKSLGCYKQGKYEEALQLIKMAEEGWVGYYPDLHQLIQKIEQATANQNR